MMDGRSELIPYAVNYRSSDKNARKMVLSHSLSTQKNVTLPLSKEPTFPS